MSTAINVVATADQTAGQLGASSIEDQKSVAITVYNSDLGLVKDTRLLQLPRGTSQLRFMDVAQQINAASVHIKSLTAPACAGSRRTEL